VVKVKLDLNKLLGFNILAQGDESAVASDKLGSKIGDKGVDIGIKVGMKEGTKPVVPNRH
jgi:hypothetical protein